MENLFTVKKVRLESKQRLSKQARQKIIR